MKDLDELRNAKKLPLHVQAVLHALSKAIDSLNDADDFISCIEGLGKKHQHLSIKDNHFEVKNDNSCFDIMFEKDFAFSSQVYLNTAR